MRIFLSDDPEIVLRGVADVLEADPGHHRGEGVKTADEALTCWPALHPAGQPGLDRHRHPGH
jgi:hypothetical protein